MTNSGARRTTIQTVWQIFVRCLPGLLAVQGWGIPGPVRAGSARPGESSALSRVFGAREAVSDFLTDPRSRYAYEKAAHGRPGRADLGRAGLVDFGSLTGAQGAQISICFLFALCVIFLLDAFHRGFSCDLLPQNRNLSC